MSEELIKTCEEIRAVLNAHSRLVARLMSVPAGHRYDGFRILGRRKDTGILVAGVEWGRSAETRQLVQASEVFTACEWVHDRQPTLVA